MYSRSFAFASLLQIGFSQANLREIIRYGMNPENFLARLDSAELTELGIRSDRIERLVAAHAKFDSAEFEKLLRASRASVALCDGLWTIEYPILLSDIPSAPALLFIRGVVPSGSLLSIVGSRKPTEYSGRVLRQWVPAFVSEGYSIVSGGAYGVDSLAHLATLEAGGRTVAVLGTGIDIAYPASHAPLYDRIINEGGAVVSQFPFGTAGTTYTFPARNATIAGIAQGTLVMEAAEKSGSLITARFANDFGREVFALPWDIFRESSSGANALIRAGEAMSVSSARDIIDALWLSSAASISPIDSALPFASDDPIECGIVEILRTKTVTVDILVETLGLDIGVLSSRLVELELRDIIIRHPHGTYELR